MLSQELFLIDGHALCYRAFYALKLTNSRGHQTNAVYGFINTVRKILREYDPKYVVVCFDAKGKTKREERFAEYKIQRQAMPEGLSEQIPLIKEVLKDYGIAMCEEKGYEADDLIATLAKTFSKKNIDVVIVTDDKDMFQLVNGHIKILSARKDEMMDHQVLKEKLGFEPEQIIDFLSLAGDQSDNIPGVKGIGEVTARSLIQEFGNLEQILKNVEKIKSNAVREKLKTQTDMAVLSRELAVLDDQVPVDLNIKNFEVGQPNRAKLHQIFKELEFRRLAEEFADQDVRNREDVSAIQEIDAKKNLKSFIQSAEGQEGPLAFFISVHEEELLPAEIYAANGKKEIVQISADQLIELKPLLENKKVNKVTFRLKEAVKFLTQQDIELKGLCFDVLTAAFLLGKANPSSTVNDLIWACLQKSIDKGQVKAEVAMFVELYEHLKQELEQKKLSELFNHIEIPLSFVLAKMELSGVKLDTDWLNNLSKECDIKIQELTKKLFSLSKEEFNLNSPKQLGVILFEKLKLPVVKKTKTGFSTDEEVLTKLAVNHEFPALLLEYRQLAKLKSTYIDALPKLVNPSTNRIHGIFEQLGAETGRLSSKQPNLQNIPIRTELGRQIRAAFVASDKNHILLSADYSQIELRILAHLSQDPTLMSAFEKDEDIHKFTAAQIFEVKEKDVDYKMRDTAKRINFGIVYGMSSFGLSKDLGISTTEAQDFIDRYFLRYPKVKEFMDQAIESCEREGFAVTMLGRRRYIPDIASRNIGVRQFAQRQAINTPVQGTAADLMKLAMIDIEREMEKQNVESKMIITVHDELVFDILKDEEKEMADLIKNKMELALKLSVPIKVSVKKGDNWLKMTEIKI